MAIRLVGYQPQYFPRLHYFARILNADIFKVSDNLQYVRRHSYPSADGKTHNGPSYQAHTPIKTANGVLLLDVPVRHAGKKEDRMLNSVEVDYATDWAQKHLRGIAISHGKSSQFKDVYPCLLKLLEARYQTLADLTIATTLWGIARLFEIPNASEITTLAEIERALPPQPLRLKKIVRMSETGLLPAEKSTGQDINTWLIDQCKKLGANEYYFGGTAAGTYIDQNRLREAGIMPIQQDWKCAPYAQQFEKVGFVPNLSIIDLLMNVPPAKAREILATPDQ